MPKTIIKIKTWRCVTCDYSQDFEPTQDNCDKHFNSDEKFKISNVKKNECPSCRLKGSIGQMAREINVNKKITLTVMGKEDIEDEINDIKKENLKDNFGVIKHDLSTPAKENVYRDKRKEDISEAIIEARKLEDK